MDGFRLHAGQVGKTFCRATGRRGEQRVQSQRLKHLQDAAHGSRFAGARAAGQDNEAVARRRGDGKLLFLGKSELTAL